MIKSKVKRSRVSTNSKVIKQIKAIAGTIKAGYPKENKQSFEVDENGYTALDKAVCINYSDEGYRPYVKVAYKRNEKKYQGRIIAIAKAKNRAKARALKEDLGREMVADIKVVLREFKIAPANSSAGTIDSTISYYIKESK